MRSSPRTHFGGLFGRRMTGEADRREGVELGRRSHGGRRWKADSGQGTAGLARVSGGKDGGDSEDARGARNRGATGCGRRIWPGTRAWSSSARGRRKETGRGNKKEFGVPWEDEAVGHDEATAALTPRMADTHARRRRAASRDACCLAGYRSDRPVIPVGPVRADATQI